MTLQAQEILAAEVQKVIAALRTLRMNPVAYERNLCKQIEEVLTAAKIGFVREFKLAPRCRIDYITDAGVGIEVKKGKPNSRLLSVQVSRYCEAGPIRALVIVVERCVFKHDAELMGKPIHYVALNKLWGIAV
jgi:hypothetical protein